MSNRREEIYQFLPLQEPTLIILLSLADGEKHGYAILKDVAEISNGKVRLSTGTLYEALARLLDQGLIERATDLPKEVREDRHPGRPRKAYRLTLKGGQVIRAEISRLQILVATAQQRLDFTASD